MEIYPRNVVGSVFVSTSRNLRKVVHINRAHYTPGTYVHKHRHWSIQHILTKWKGVKPNLIPESAAYVIQAPSYGENQVNSPDIAMDFIIAKNNFWILAYYKKTILDTINSKLENATSDHLWL